LANLNNCSKEFCFFEICSSIGLTRLWWRLVKMRGCCFIRWLGLEKMLIFLGVLGTQILLVFQVSNDILKFARHRWGLSDSSTLETLPRLFSSEKTTISLECIGFVKAEKPVCLESYTTLLSLVWRSWPVINFVNSCPLLWAHKDMASNYLRLVLRRIQIKEMKFLRVIALMICCQRPFVSVLVMQHQEY